MSKKIDLLHSQTVRTLSFEVVATIPALCLLAMSYIPIYVMITYPMKSTVETMVDFWGWPKHFNGYVFAAAWREYRGNMFNTIAVILVTCVILLLTSVLSGYVFATLNFPGKETLYLAILSMLMIPSVLTIVPTFTTVMDLGLYDSYWGLILPWAAAGQAWGVMFVRNHMEGLPHELFESARIDGCSTLGCLLRIALPLSRSVMATVIIVKMVDYFNDFTWPLLIIQSSARQVITVAARASNGNVACYAICSIPLAVLFLCTSRLYIEGMTTGALKA